MHLDHRALPRNNDESGRAKRYSDASRGVAARHAESAEPAGIGREDRVSRAYQYPQHQIQRMRDAGGKNYLIRSRENIEIGQATLDESPQRLEAAGSSAVEPASLPSERAQRGSDLDAIQPFRRKHP